MLIVLNGWQNDRFYYGIVTYSNALLPKQRVYVYDGHNSKSKGLQKASMYVSLWILIQTDLAQ